MERGQTHVRRGLPTDSMHTVKTPHTQARGTVAYRCPMHRALRLEEEVGVRHSAGRAEYQRPYIRAHAARAYTFAESLAPPHCHIRPIPRICDLRRSPTFPLPNTATRVAIASPRRGHFTLSPPSPLTLSARPHRSAVNVVSGSRLIRPDAHYTTVIGVLPSVPRSDIVYEACCMAAVQ